MDPETAPVPAPRFQAGPAPGLPTLSRDLLERLHAHQPLRNVFHIGLEWAGILAAVAAGIAVDHLLFYLVLVPWIGSRQHALAALVHEAAHGRLLPGRWNDRVGELILAWPLGLSLYAYRRVHLAHHRHLGTLADPDWARNRPDRLRSLRGAVPRTRLLLGIAGEQRELLRMFAGTGESTQKPKRFARTGFRLAYYAVLVAAISWFGVWSSVLLFWMLPYCLWFLPSMRLRGIAEHWAVDESNELRKTRTLLLGPLGRIFLLPKAMGYHLEHHLFPRVPFQHLPELHRELLRQPEYRAQACITQGLGALVSEIRAFPGS